MSSRYNLNIIEMCPQASNFRTKTRIYSTKEREKEEGSVRDEKQVESEDSLLL